MRLNTDADIITACVKRVIPLTTVTLGDEYRYQSLPLCVIDAVFSIGIKYVIVKNVITRYCTYTRQKPFRSCDKLSSCDMQESINDFCSRPEQNDLATMALNVYGSRNRTSSRNGILKAEAAILFARCLQKHGMQYLQDIHKGIDNPQLEADIRTIPGQKSGLSLKYFWMLTGSDSLIKPDRMILRFLNEAISRHVSSQEALSLLQAVTHRLGDQYPNLTPRLLDHAIWNHQRSLQSD